MIRNQTVRAALLKNGFALLDANLAAETELLRAHLSPIFPAAFSGFYYSLLENDFETNRQTCDYIKETLHPFYEAHFTGYRTITESFLVKPANTTDELLLHQDWCYTDEKQHPAYNIWIPLDDTSENNGAMFFLPGSHLWFHNFRSASLPSARVSSKFFSSGELITVPVKRGQALLFHPAVFHGSFPNHTQKHRVIVTATLLPEHAPLLYFHQGDAAGEVNVFHLDDAALLRTLKTVAMRGTPDLPVEKRIHYAHSDIPETELLRRAVAAGL